MEIHSEAAFAASAPDPALTRRVESWARRTLGRPTGRLPFDLECRAQVCALSPAAEADPLAIEWDCHGGGCFPSRAGDHWYRHLQEKLARADRIRPPRREGPGGEVRPAFLLARDPAEAKRTSPWVSLLAFTESFDWRAAARACGSRYPGRGRLVMMIQIPRPTADRTTPPRIAFHIGGDLGGTRLARCVSSAFEAASAGLTIPEDSGGGVFHTELTYPFDASAFETKLERLRHDLRTTPSAPPF